MKRLVTRVTTRLIVSPFLAADASFLAAIEVLAADANRAVAVPRWLHWLWPRWWHRRRGWQALVASVERALTRSDDDGADGEFALPFLAAHGLGAEAIAARLFVLLYAGATTGRAIVNTLVLLSHETRVPGRDELQACVLETLRITTGPASIRTTVQAVPATPCGLALGAGELLMFNAHARHMRCAAPDRFEPRRVLASSELHAFGHGAHACPGRSVALATAVAVLGELLALTEFAHADAALPPVSWNFAAPGLASAGDRAVRLAKRVQRAPFL